MKEVLKVVGFMLLMALACALVVCLLLLGTGAFASPEEPVSATSWNAWDAELMPTPWKDGCTDKWCPSIAEGAEKGESWCLSKDGCGGYHRKESYKIYAKYEAWFDEMCNGQPGIWGAQTARTESEGDPEASIEKTGECGLMSVDQEHAEALNINSCDPKANVWAACYSRNLQLISLRESIDGLDKALIQDQWMIAGASGSAGSGKIIRILKWSKALKGKHPYNAMRSYLKGLHSKWWKATKAQIAINKLGLDDGLGKIVMTHEEWKELEPYVKVYDKTSDWGVLWNAGKSMYRPGRTAFRISRLEGARKVMEVLFPEGKMPWGEPALPPRPADILPYPGKKDHCSCHLWPELKNKAPAAEENEKWKTDTDPMDPEKMKCVSGFKGKLVCKATE